MEYSPFIKEAKEIKGIKKGGVLEKDTYLWSKFMSLDFIIDVDGIPHFLEINGVPNAFWNYYEVYNDRQLFERIVDYFPNGEKIGMLFKAYRIQRDWVQGIHKKINLKVDLILQNEFEKRGNKIILVPSDRLCYDKKGIYTEDTIDQNGEEKKIDREYFSYLFNRCLGRAKLAKLIPKEKRAELIEESLSQKNLITIFTPLKFQEIAANKRLSSEAVRDYLVTPETYYPTNIEELEEAVLKIEGHIKEHHETYQKPFMIIKPLKGTGGIGISFLEDKQGFNKKRLELENLFKRQNRYLIQERITSQTLEGRPCDLRCFFFDKSYNFERWASKCLVRVAPTDSLVTSISQGGGKIRMSEEGNERMKEYIKIATQVLEEKLSKV